MFLEDLQHKQITPIVSLDILHLCRKGIQNLSQNPNGGVGEVLGLMGSSPLLLYRFLEWQQDRQQDQGFQLSQYILRHGPEEFLQPHLKNIAALFKGQLNTKALHLCLRQFILDELPEAFSSKLDPRQFKRAGFIPFSRKCPHHLERCLYEAGALKGPLQLSDDRDDLNKETLRKCRRLIEGPMVSALEDLIQRIEREAHQSLGKRGVEEFLRATISKVSFLSLLGLARGARGDHLLLLNRHASVCAKVALQLSQNIHQQYPKVRSLASPEDLYIMGLIHDLGHALLITHFPEIHAEIWVTLQEQEQLRESGQTFLAKHYHEIEQEVISQHQSQTYLKNLQKLGKAQLQTCLESILKEKPELASIRSSKTALSSFVDAFGRSFYNNDDSWAQKLWQKLNLPKLTPLLSSNELAGHLLSHSAKEQEFVKGAYDNYAKFIKAFGYHQGQETSTSVLFIRLCNHITTEIAHELEFAEPCLYANIGNAEPFYQWQQICEKLNIPEEELRALADNIKNHVVEDFKQTHPSRMERQQACPLTHPHQLQNELQLQIADFFKRSTFFKSGILKFNILHHNIMDVLKNKTQLNPKLFVSELEKSLRHFFRIMDVVVRPREKLEHQSPDQHFAVLFESADFGEEMQCHHHRHLIADFYLLDPDGERVQHPDVAEFMQLFCDDLLLHYSSEIWELFKRDEEVARMDIARHIIAHHRLGEGLSSELLYLKARLLDGLLQRFSPEKEPIHILRVQFAVFNSLRKDGCEVFSTADFDHWQNEAHQQLNFAPDYEKQIQELGDQLNLCQDELSQALDSHQGYHPFELQIETPQGPIPLLILSLFDLDKDRKRRFLLIVVDANLKHDGPLLDKLLDKGVPQELARHHSDLTQSAGLTLLKYFASDESTSSLSRLTHLRPSRLKEMGFLIHQVERETQHLLPKLPHPIDLHLYALLDHAKQFWYEHQIELKKSAKLSRETLKKFDPLRKESDTFKKSIRIRSGDFMDILQNLPCGTFGKLRLADPMVCIPWGLDHLYLSYSGFIKFRDSVDRKINHGHPQLRSAAEILHRFESAWFIEHKDHLLHAFTTYFEELSREEHIYHATGPVSCSLTLFLYEQEVPAHPNLRFPHLALECFTPSHTSEGGQQKIVGSAGGGYSTIFRDEFDEFAAIAHRNVIRQSSNQHVMECFFRQQNETPSVRYVDPHMLKHRFYNTTGISTLFFYPCKSQHLGRQLHHGF